MTGHFCSQVLSLTFGAAATFLATRPADASLIETLTAKTAANKELNDKKRLATSGANFARSRTVTDGTCAFPDNLIGCENKAEVRGARTSVLTLRLRSSFIISRKVLSALGS